MQVWVDTKSGTWGEEDPDNPSIYVVDVETYSPERLEWVEDMSDTGRVVWVKTFGVPLRMMGCK